MCNHDLRTSPETSSVLALNGSAPSVSVLNDFPSTVSIVHDLASGTSPGDDVVPIPPGLGVRVSFDGANHVVTLSGELDVRTRQLAENACLTGHGLAVVVDMSELSFMDCCGYAGLIAIRRALLAEGGSLTLTNQSGQPARLLALLGTAESMRQVESASTTR